MSHSCSRPHPCPGDRIMPRITEYQSPVSGLFPHCLPDRRSDGASGHVSAAIGLRLSPPRPAARARVLLRGLYANPTWAGDGMAGLSGRWVLPGTGRTGGIWCWRWRWSARITLAPQAVRRLESRARTGFRRTRPVLAVWTLASATWSDAAGARFVGIRSNAAVRPCSRADRERRGACRRSVDVAALDSRGVRRDRARRAADAAAAGHVPDLERLPARAGLVPADLLERDGHRLRARRAARRAPDARAGASTRSIRVVAAAALPPIAVTLYLTFSRGAIWVLPVGFVLYVLLAQPRGLLTAAAGGGHPGGDRGQGRLRQRVAGARGLRHLRGRRRARAATSALVVLACAVGAAALRAAALPLDRAPGGDRDRGGQPALPAPGARPAGSWSRSLLGALAADAPRRICDARATFCEGRYMDYSDDLRDAADLGGRQRADRQLARRAGRVRRARRCTAPAPAPTGSPGTRDRPAPPIKVNDGHSLYLEMLSELGVVGLVLLLVALGTLLVVGAARLGGPERHAHGAVRGRRA